MYGRQTRNSFDFQLNKFSDNEQLLHLSFAVLFLLLLLQLIWKWELIIDIFKL